MKERPILFSSAMVRAILEGRKVQTRRVIKDQPNADWHPGPVGWYAPTMVDKHGEEYPGGDVYGASDEDEGRISPYGIPGDRLWVRETLRPSQSGITVYGEDECPAWREGESVAWPWPKAKVVTQGMPRWASRITLEITDVRVHRLQEISCEDVLAEGAPYCNREYSDGAIGCVGNTTWFKNLWDSINAKKHPWSSNPWIWALTFRRLA